MFIITLVIFYQYYSNTVAIDLGEVESVRRDAYMISNFLMSEGYPADWNSTSVEHIGVVEENFRLNNSKLQTLTTLDYDTTRRLFNTKYNYYFYFLDKNKQVANMSTYGKPGINMTNVEEIEDPNKIVTISRFIFFERKIYRMVLYVWD